MPLNIISHPQDIVAVEPARAPIGRVAEVHGPVVDIACETLPPLHRALQLSIDGGSAVLEVLHHLDSHHVRAIALHRTAGLQRGTPIFDSGGPLRVPVSGKCLGRLLDVFGAPLDGGPPLAPGEFRDLLSPPPSLRETMPSSGILETGIKVIDLLCPFIRGRQDRTLRRRGRGQDGAYHGVHAGGRFPARRSVGVRGGRGAHPRRPRAVA